MPHTPALLTLVLLLTSIAVAIGWFANSRAPLPSAPTIAGEFSPTPAEVPIPLGLPKLKIPARNELTQEKIALGKRLFFDANLSADRTMSCATCHDPNKGWSNDKQFATGVDGTVGRRNTPTLFNVAYNRFQFWDGRASTLEKQALGPILNPEEMALDSHETLVARVSEDPEYQRMFAAAFADGISVDNVAKAIASFERTILAGDTPYDRFQAGDEDALSEQARRGMRLYFRGNRTRCVACHPAPLFTDSLFYNLGVGMDKPNPDVGFKATSKFDSDMGKFKTPTLRNIAKTAPYMHDGSMKTLDEVMDFYIKGGHRNPYIDNDVVKLRINEQEKQEIIAFMVEGLTSPSANETANAVEPANQP